MTEVVSRQTPARLQISTSLRLPALADNEARQQLPSNAFAAVFTPS